MTDEMNEKNDGIPVPTTIQEPIERPAITHQNPLMEFTRKPEIYISLPSNGYFTKPNNVDLSINGELGISAMTTSDELLLKTPDALLNGEAIEKIIHSCAPGVKNVRTLPSPDVDAILVGIRMASYGDNMEFNATCPECETVKDFAISLTDALARIEHLEKEYVVELSNKMKVSLRPHTYESNIKQGLMIYNESQIIKVVLNEDLEDPETSKQYQESFNKMVELLVELTADSIITLWDPDGNFMNVTPEQILEWLKNIPRADANILQEKVNKINETGVYRKINIKCDNEECEHEWETEVFFDASNFFE